MQLRTNAVIAKLKSSKGMTLIELMIVVAIVGILSAIAYPSYTEYVLRGRRAEARTALMDLMQQQERYFTQNNTYLKFDTSNLGVTNPATVPFKHFSGDSAANGYYYLSAKDNCPSSSNIALCVNLIAVPKTTDTGAGTIGIDSTGLKSCTGDMTKCWK
jgi:type IV pilus assembly protein PilE